MFLSGQYLLHLTLIKKCEICIDYLLSILFSYMIKEYIFNYDKTQTKLRYEKRCKTLNDESLIRYCCIFVNALTVMVFNTSKMHKFIRTFSPSTRVVTMTTDDTFSCQIILQKSPRVFGFGPSKQQTQQ